MIKPMKNIARGILLALGVASANAAIVVDVRQVGANVFASGGGSINLTDLTLGGGAFSAGVVWPGFPLPVPTGSSVLSIGTTSTAPVNLYRGISGPTSFGSGGRILADSGSGPVFAIISSIGLYVPDPYVSGGILSSSSTWDNITLAGLGLTVGSYVWTWGSRDNADSFTLNIVDPRISTVPEPGTLALLGLGVLGLLLLRRKAMQV